MNKYYNNINYTAVKYHSILHGHVCIMVNSVGEERADCPAIDYLLFCGFCLEGFPLSLGAWDRLLHVHLSVKSPVPSQSKQ